MKNIASVALSIIFVFAISSCTKELLDLDNRFTNVEKDLWKYYSEFEYQAEIRGLKINLESLNISGEISDIAEKGIAGSCQYGSSINSHIIIDQPFWKNSTDLAKEFVVFHELGHCVLYRDHNESKNQNGTCQSIMRSGLGDCIDAYTLNNRKTYLDELFFDD